MIDCLSYRSLKGGGGGGGEAFHWIRSFLSNRTQYVVVDGHKSLKSLIISGVPQGTVLGPILFIIYINDIIDHVSHSTIRCFADVTRVCKSIADCSNILEHQRDLDSKILCLLATIWHYMKTSLSTSATKQTSTIHLTNFHLLPCSINTQLLLETFCLL